MNELDVMLAMQDDAFQQILKNDQIINELEKEKNNADISIFDEDFKDFSLDIIDLDD